MRHRKNSFKIGKTSSHRRCLVANMLKSLIEHGRVETTIVKAKEVRRHADRMITLAKKNTLFSKRQAIAELMITFNPLTSKEARAAKDEAKRAAIYNTDRQVIGKLFGDLSQRFANRNGGYTRIIRKDFRVGDNAAMCILEYLPE